MTTAASATFHHLVLKLYQSQLHFCLTETPYSAQIVIRKRYIKDQSGPSLQFSSDKNAENDEIQELNVQVSELKKTVENSNKIIEILENKVAKAETQALKAFEEKKTGILALKKSLKKSEDEMKTFKKDLENEQKESKVKEKAIYQLEKKCDNLNSNNKKLKTEVAQVKNENKKLLKSKAKSEKQNACNPNKCLPLTSSLRSCPTECNPPQQHACVEPAATVLDAASDPADRRLHSPPTAPGCTIGCPVFHQSCQIFLEIFSPSL